ncbi:MAG: 6-carboxytetrahydropterin synthase QueD [Candidatus Peregrinibacteria bacterium]
MFLVTKEFIFDSAHFLPFYEGKCETLHGHTYKIHVTVQAQKDEKTGMAFDFVELKKAVKTEIVDLWDHQLINDHIENPSAENMAEYAWEKMEEHQIPVFEVKVWETPTSFVTYRGGKEF